MLLAVEGGGFFSSSASGYTNGLALLLFGRRNEEPMKVSPWNRYQLVEQEFEPEPRSTARKTQNSRGCASFNCFGCAHLQLDRHSPNAASLVNQSETHPETASSDTSRTSTTDALNKSDKKPCLKNNLKKPSRDCSATCEVVNVNELSEQVENETSCSTLERKVQWTDKCGKELAEIREFELSDYGLSDEEFNQEKFRRCDCVIQ